MKQVLFTVMIWQSENSPELCEKLLQTFPCRIICMNTGTKRQSREESEHLFHVTIPEDEGDQLPLVILPLIVPDLPLFLWWCGPFVADSSPFRALHQLATRTIVSESPEEQLKCPNPIVDLNWNRLLGLRETIAKVFDTQERIATLQESDEIVIHHNDSHTLPAQYLKAWLQHRLQLPNAAFKLVAQSDDTYPDGTILSFLTKASDNRTTTLHRIGPSQVTVYVATKELCELPLTLPLQSGQLSGPVLHSLFYRPLTHDYVTIIETLIGDDSWKK